MIKYQNCHKYHCTLIIVALMCGLVLSSGCRGFSIGTRSGLFGIPIDFSQREKLPKPAVDDLHEIMLAENASRDMRQHVDDHAVSWSDTLAEAPNAADWYVGITALDEPHRTTPDNGIVQASYSQQDVTQGIVNAAMTQEAVSGQYNNNIGGAVHGGVPIPLEQDRWVANLELERYRDGKTDQPPESPWRWRHRGLEEIRILPPEHQPDWQALLRHENPLVRGNAMITLARAGDTRTGDALVALANDVSRSLAMRCAAVEALASLPTTTPDTLLVLSDTYCDYTDANGNRKGGVPELAIEVLYALAARMPMSNEPCFMRPLESRDAKVRLAAVCVWRDNPPQQQGQVFLPDCLVRYCGDPNTAIQEAALIAVARWRHPQAMICLDMGLRNPRASTRIAAIRGLGILQTDEAIVLLGSLTNDPSSAIRAEVVTAFGQVGLHDKVYPMCDDPGWEVRKAVARELAKSDHPRTHAIAQKYLRDVSVQVQLTTLDSLRHWHPESTAELLFGAMGGNALETRIQATEMLARYWEPARQYQPNSRTETRKAHYQQLAAQFQHDWQTGALQAGIASVLNEGRGTSDEGRGTMQTGNALVPNGSGMQLAQQSIQQAGRESHEVVPDVPAQADYDHVRMLLAQLHQGGTPQQYQHTLTQLAGTGPMLLPILEQLVVVEGRPLHDAVTRQVLPDVDSLFEITRRLDQNDTGLRRTAVAELVGETKFGEVSPLLYRQLAAHAVREHDEIVLQRLWDFTDRQAEKLAQLDIDRHGTQTADQVTLRQQELLALTLGQLRKSLTAGSLAHASPELHRRACLHIGEYGQFDDIPALLAEINHPTTSVSRAALQALAKIGTKECAANVRPLLTHAQPLVVVDAALALDRWGDPEGQNALERLAVSGDRTTKMAIAQGVKKTPDRKYIPLLVRLLDESGAIRQEALDALPLAAGHDIVPPQEMAYYSPQERIALWKQRGTQ
ncbi:MAG: HEAT repeat domain-containing protein [Planctomycetaceae bacterium]|nr:HEAT repeat domain-containing protein [Planctomycetaceae bacterium]